MNDVSTALSAADARNRDLVRRWRAGDAGALGELLQANLGLVRKIAQRAAAVADRGHDDWLIDDLVQESMIEMLKVLQSYDPDKGALSTYVIRRLRLRCRRWVNTRLSAITVPYRMFERGPRPIAEADMRAARQARSNWSAPVDREGRCTLRHVPAAEPDRSPVEREAQREGVREGLRHLEPRRRVAITRKFGLDDEPVTLLAIAGELGISRARAQQLQQTGLRQLRKHLAPLVGESA